MTGQQLQAVLKAFDKRAEHSDLRRDRYTGVSTFEVVFESFALCPAEGRSNEQAIQEVIGQVKALVKELEEIGV